MSFAVAGRLSKLRAPKVPLRAALTSNRSLLRSLHSGSTQMQTLQRIPLYRMKGDVAANMLRFRNLAAAFVVPFNSLSSAEQPGPIASQHRCLHNMTLFHANPDWLARKLCHEALVMLRLQCLQRPTCKARAAEQHPHTHNTCALKWSVTLTSGRCL